VYVSKPNCPHITVTSLGSYCTLGPVNGWMGDRLWTGKPPQHKTKHPCLLSLIHPRASMGRRDEYPAKSEGVSGTPHDTLDRIHGLTVWDGV